MKAESTNWTSGKVYTLDAKEFIRLEIKNTYWKSGSDFYFNALKISVNDPNKTEGFSDVWLGRYNWTWFLTTKKNCNLTEQSRGGDWTAKHYGVSKTIDYRTDDDMEFDGVWELADRRKILTEIQERPNDVSLDGKLKSESVGISI